MPSETSKEESLFPPTDKRYRIAPTTSWGAYIEDTYTMEEVACCDSEVDAEVICDCLNAIEYVR